MNAALTDVFLHPGEWFAGGAGQCVRTLLGSCVSVTLWHRASRTGAMSHGVLFARRGEAGTANAHYGAEALELMLAELGRLGIAGHDCVASVVGGGSMFREAPVDHLGRQHGEAMRALLRTYRIPVRAVSLFGYGYRQLRFDLATGEVAARLVPPEACLALLAGGSRSPDQNRGRCGDWGSTANSWAALQGLRR